jgi:DTW domain-containing protein YfiP
MALKKFTQFITEKQTDKELKQQAEEDLGNVVDTCPRCGKSFHDCICPEIDYFSTVNIYRTPKGEIKSGKTK